METEIYLDESIYNSITNLVLYQNNILIRKIAQDYPQWKLRNLKKYIKDKPEKTKIPKSKPKKKIIKPKKEDEDNSDSDSDSEVKIIKKKVVLKRKKGKKGNDDYGYNLVEYQGEKYYIDIKTNYVYQNVNELDELDEDEDLEVEFVGMLEGKKINFDAESSS